MRKIVLLLVIGLSIINSYGQGYTTCSTTAGALSGTNTGITVNQSTLAAVYTTTPSPAGTIPQNEFLIVLHDSLAYDNLGNTIISSSNTAVITPSSLNIAVNDTFSIVSFSYDIQQFKLLTDGLLTNSVPFLGSCCGIVDNQSGVSGFCTSLNAVGISDSADVNTLQDVINIVSIYNYGVIKPLSLKGLNNGLDSLNADIGTYDGIGCTNAIVGICYAFDTLSTKHDIYTVVVPPCTVTIPDANFKAYLVGNAAINTNGNTEIECSEATAFTGIIACNGLSISDLTGIEAFTALTELYCYSNSLTSLDVTQNTALTDLSCAANTLSSLDVTQNTALTLLYCQVNSISSLDVTQNISLISLLCQGNSLSSLDVTQNIALTKLLCQGSSLTSLDVSNNPFLTELDCGASSISSLDVTQNTALTKLYCNQNSLTTLNVANGNNSNFISFFANNNPNLTCITVDNVAYSTTNWTSIDAQTSFGTNCGTVGIDEVAVNSVNIYPNPVKNLLFIELANQEVTEITIIDYSGRIVKTITNNTTKSIDVSSLTKGIYILKVATENGVLTNRFIKQ